MSFDVATTCGDSSLSAAAVVLVALWFLPAVLLALRNCRPARRRSRGMNLSLAASFILSTLLSTVWADLVPEVIVMPLLVAALMIAAAVAGLGLFRWSLK